MKTLSFEKYVAENEKWLEDNFLGKRGYKIPA
jgi:hypothetical protein